MKLKHGKKYETAGGVVYRVRDIGDNIFDVSNDARIHWRKNGTGCYEHPDLIRRHYTKPKPAHKLDLKPGDVVKLVAWEDGYSVDIGDHKTVGINNIEIPSSNPKGERPLFKVLSRANSPAPAS